MLQTQIPPKRITRTYTIKPLLYKQVKTIADKDERIISRIIENGLARYVQSRT
jgi:hypothetical protein